MQPAPARSWSRHNDALFNRLHWTSAAALELDVCLQPVHARQRNHHNKHDLPLPADLRSLHLPGNKLSRLEGLEELTTLRELVLDGNPIKHLDPASFSGGGSIKLVHYADRCPSHAMADQVPELHVLVLDAASFLPPFSWGED